MYGSCLVLYHGSGCQLPSFQPVDGLLRIVEQASQRPAGLPRLFTHVACFSFEMNTGLYRTGWHKGCAAACRAGTSRCRREFSIPAAPGPKGARLIWRQWCPDPSRLRERRFCRIVFTDGSSLLALGQLYTPCKAELSRLSGKEAANVQRAPARACGDVCFSSVLSLQFKAASSRSLDTRNISMVFTDCFLLGSQVSNWVGRAAGAWVM